MDNAQAFDTRLGEATSERSKELDAFAERVMQSLDERIAQAVEESSVKSASDPRMAKLVEMIAGAEVALDRVAERVEALEAFAVAATRRRDERRRDNGPASRERDGRPAGSARCRPRHLLPPRSCRRRCESGTDARRTDEHAGPQGRPVARVLVAPCGDGVVVRVPLVTELIAVFADTCAGVAHGLLNLGFELVAEPLRSL